MPISKLFFEAQKRLKGNGLIRRISRAGGEFQARSDVVVGGGHPPGTHTGRPSEQSAPKIAGGEDPVFYHHFCKTGKRHRPPSGHARRRIFLDGDGPGGGGGPVCGTVR